METKSILRSTNPKENPEKNVAAATPRDQYLLEKEKIKSEIGDLEQIRVSLGLSQRRVCQLLLVDPSAWTRWLKTPSGAPPHVYQALKWLMELKKTNPEAAAPSNIASRVDFIHSSTQSKFKEIESSLALLERAVSLSATVQPAETHFVEEIAVLKAQMALLLEQKRAVKTTRPQPRKKRPRKKASAKIIKKVKKPSKKAIRKGAKKRAKKKRSSPRH